MADKAGSKKKKKKKNRNALLPVLDIKLMIILKYNQNVNHHLMSPLVCTCAVQLFKKSC